MAKRKQSKATDDGDDDGSDSDVSLIDVDFEFFDPNPAVDYLALKRLLIQLFQADAELFALHDLADLILSQPLLGTTVKTDGIEGDPYAYLSVLNMHVHQNHPSMKAIREYILAKSAANAPLHAALQTLLGAEGLKTQNHVGFVFSERLINMPVQVVPPMYRMLADEIQWANDDKEPYTFTHYLVLTRTYRLTAEQAMELDESTAAQPPPKKRKNKATAAPPAPAPPDGPGTYSYHPEDEYIQKHALFTVDYPLSTQTKDTFGLDTGGRMMLVSADRFRVMIDAMLAAFAVAA